MSYLIYMSKAKGLSFKEISREDTKAVLELLAVRKKNKRANNK